MKRNILSTKTSIALLLLFPMLIPLTGYTSDLDEELVNAAGNGDTARVKALLAKGADVNAKDMVGNTPLMWAAHNRRTETVHALLARGAEGNVKNNQEYTALIKAVSGGSADIVRALLAKGADVNVKAKNGMTALGIAEFRGDADSEGDVWVKAMLKSGLPKSPYDFYYLGKISNPGRTLEEVWHSEDYLTEIDQNHPKYRVYYRK